MVNLGDQCRAAIKTAVGNDLTDDQIGDMVKRVLDKRAEMIRLGKIMDDPDAILKAVKQMADDEKIAALIEKRSRAINVTRAKDRRGRVEANLDDAVGALKSTVIPVEASRDSYARSAETLIEVEKSRALGALAADLDSVQYDGKSLTWHITKNNNWLKTSPADRRKFDLDVTIETARTNGGKEAPTGNKLAEAIGTVYAKHFELMRVARNDAGAWTRKIEAYIGAQKYDQRSVMKMSTDEFRSMMNEHLDSVSFEDLVDLTPDEFLSHVKVGLETGVHLKSTESDWLNGFHGGTQNVAKRASAERVLHYKSAESWFIVNERIGDGSIHEALLYTLSKGATDIGLMKMFGTNPRSAFKADIDWLTAKLHDQAAKGDANALKQLNQLKTKTPEGGWFSSLLDQLDGTANIPVYPTVAETMRGIRSYESVIKLGFSPISGFSDFFSRAGAMQWHGQGYFSGLAKGIAAVFGPLGENERNVVARHMLASSNGTIGDVASRIDAGNTIGGHSSKLLNLYMTMIGQKWMADRLRLQSIRDMWNSITINADRSFDELPKPWQISMRRYGIGDQHWDYMRKNLMTDVDGAKYVTTGMIRDESDDVVRQMMGKPKASAGEIKRFKDDFESVLRGYFVGTAEEAITDPNAATRSLVSGLGTTQRPGTLGGEFVRTLTQFKSYPVAMILRHWNREINRGERPNLSGMVGLILGMTAAGYISITTKDLLKGRSVKDIEDGRDFAKIALASFTQGGALGIMGDVIFADHSKYNAESHLIGGPTFGSAADLLSLAWAKNVGEDNWQSRAINVANNHIPGVNIWYTKIPWEFLVLHSLQDEANAGYMGRVERRMDKENKQHFLF